MYLTYKFYKVETLHLRTNDLQNFTSWMHNHNWRKISFHG